METTKIYRSIANLRDIDMFYFDTRTEGPVIVCLHGRWGRSETWYDFIQYYGKQYRIIAPDQRGHGLSSKPISKYSSEEMAEDVIDLLNYLKLDSVILVGHSMGAHIAACVAAKRPEYISALALLDKTAAGPDMVSALPLEQFVPVDPVTKDWPLPFDSLNQAMNFIRRSMESDLSYQYFMNSLIETVDGYQMMFSPQAMAANIQYDESWFGLLPKISCPTLLLIAEGYQGVSEQDFLTMQSLLPNCISHVMSHADHNVHLSNQEEFYCYFNKLLAKI